MHTLDEIWNAITNLPIPSKEDIANKVEEKIGNKDVIAATVASRLRIPPDPTTMLNTLAVTIDSIDKTITDVIGRLEAAFPVRATVIGDANHPVTANIGGTDVPIKLAPVSASLDINATVGGTQVPIRLDPIKIDVEHLQITPNISIEFRLFGLLIGSIHITGNANIN